ncbi:MAG: hypothetical protein ABL911_08430 [Gallionella sp.]|nr:hypothetical protein [Gallionella sp.]
MQKIIYILAAIVAAMAMASHVYAVPGYTRQTGLECSICHFQSFPALNEMGRSFKAGGYTMTGGQLKVEGTEGFSLPATLNAGVVTKIRYQKTNGTTTAVTHTTNDGQLQFPDELLLIAGGRVSENIGAQLELNLKNTGGSVVENFKIPFIYNVSNYQAGVIPFTTGTQGVAYGFELLNTGAVRGGRIMEARKSFSAQQYIGTAGAAEGVAVIASNTMYFANFSKWSPRSVGAANSGAPTASYLRLAVTPKMGIWDTGLGAQLWNGSATKPDLTAVEIKAYAIDAQAQGEVAAMPLGVYLTHANASGSNQVVGTIKNFFNANPNAITATTIAGQLGVLPGKATLLMAYRKGDNGKATGSGDNALMIGGTYQIVQNVQLQFNHEMYSGSAYDGSPANGSQLSTLMLFGAF